MRDYLPAQSQIPTQFYAQRVLVLVWLSLAACLLLVTAQSPGQTTADPPALQAAYLYNFAKYVKWPATKSPAHSSPINIGFLGKTPVSAKLAESVKNKTVQGREIIIIQSDTIEGLQNCHIIYVSLTETARLVAALQALKDAPILTVGENRDFLDKGGMIRVFLDHESMRFDVNLPQVQKAGLVLDPNMLSCAHKVIRSKP